MRIVECDLSYRILLETYIDCTRGPGLPSIKAGTYVYDTLLMQFRDLAKHPPYVNPDGYIAFQDTYIEWDRTIPRDDIQFTINGNPDLDITLRIKRTP